MAPVENVPADRNTHALDRVLKYAYVVNWEVIAYAVLFVLAVATRFVNLGARVMSHDESLHTKFSWDLYRNGYFQHTPLMHGPLLFHMTAFFYLLFGDNDFTARIYTAVVGVAVVMMPVFFRRWLGRVGALLTSLLFLISPLLMYYSRYIREDMPAILYTLIMVYATFQYLDGPEETRGKPRWLILLAAAMILTLASKEVAFIYIAIFGSFLTLYWVVSLAQQYLKQARNGRTLFGLITTGMIIGVIAALAMIALVSIIPPGDLDADGVTNASDNCTNVANPLQLDDNGDGVGNDCQFNPGPVLAARLAAWTLLIFGGLGVALIGTAQWVMRRNSHPFPWREVVLIMLIAVVACGFFLVVEEATRKEPVTATPLDPNAQESTATGNINLAPIVLAWVIGVAVVALSVAGRRFGFWEEMRRFPVFDVLIVMGTLILPWLTAFVIYLTGAHPTDYSPQGIVRAALALVPFAAVAVAVGMAWNWRVWLAATGVFMAIFVFFFTTMFTNGQGLASGMVGSLGYWLEQQGVRRGNQPQYYYTLLMIPFYEFLPLIGAVAAGLLGLTEWWRFRHARMIEQAVATDDLEQTLMAAAEEAAAREGLLEGAGRGVPSVSRENPGALAVAGKRDSQAAAAMPAAQIPALERLTTVPFLAFTGYWAVFNIYAYTLSGEKMPWLTTHLTVPLAMLAGWFGGRVIARVSRESFRALGWRLLLLVPLLIVALARVFGAFLFGRYPFQGVSKLELDRTLSWLAAVLVAAGVAYVIARIWRRIGWEQVWRLSILAGGILLTVLTARSAFMASFINYDLATEYLVYAHSGPAHTTIFNTLKEISQRVTGGMDLRVAYDYKMSWPGSWYFREFPNAVYFDRNPSVQVLDEAVAVVIGSESRAQVEPLLGDRYYHQEFVRMWWPMQDYFNLTAARIDNVFDFSPANSNAALLRRGLWDIWWNRDYTTYGQATGGNFSLGQWPVSDRMHFYVRKDVAAQIWDLGVGAEVVSEFDTSLADLWTTRAASIVWGQEGSAEGQLNHPRGLAIGADGTLYVADSLNHRIQAFDADGNYLFGWGTYEVGEYGTATGGNFNQPWGVAVGPDGNVYVADTWNHRVQVFTPDGQFLRAWGQLGQLDAARDPDDFWGPRAIAVDKEGLVYVADTGNKRIRVYTAEGQWLRDIGSGGTAAGQLNEPVGLAIHPDGRVFIADTWNRRIQVFNTMGQYLTSWVIPAWYGDQGNRPYLALDVQRGHLYVTDPDAARLIVYDFNGTLLGSFGQPGSKEAPMNAAQINVVGGVAIDAQGRVFVADAGAGRILRFPPWDEIAVAPLLPQDEAPAGDSAQESEQDLPALEVTPTPAG